MFACGRHSRYRNLNIRGTVPLWLSSLFFSGDAYALYMSEGGGWLMGGLAMFFVLVFALVSGFVLAGLITISYRLKLKNQGNTSRGILLTLPAVLFSILGLKITSRPDLGFLSIPILIESLALLTYAVPVFFASKRNKKIAFGLLFCVGFLSFIFNSVIVNLWDCIDSDPFNGEGVRVSEIEKKAGQAKASLLLESGEKIVGNFSDIDAGSYVKIVRKPGNTHRMFSYKRWETYSLWKFPLIKRDCKFGMEFDEGSDFKIGRWEAAE